MDFYYSTVEPGLLHPESIDRRGTYDFKSDLSLFWVYPSINKSGFSLEES
jgi:hypothetical protein